MRNFLTILLLLVHFAIKAQNTLFYTDPSLHFRNGLELWEVKNYAAAQQAFQNYLQINPQASLKAAEASYYIAFCALYLDNPDAEYLITNFIAQYPNHPKALEAYYELGNFYYQDKDYKKAIQYFEKISFKQLPADKRAEARFKLGYAYFMQKDLTKARDNFNQVKATNSAYKGAASYYAGYIAYQKEQYKEALPDLTVAANEANYQESANFLISNIYYKQKNYAEVINRFAQYPPKTADSYLLLGDAYYQQKNYAQAAIQFKEYLKLRKGKPTGEIAYRIGYTQYQVEDFEDAAASLKEVAGENSALGQSASYYLGFAYLKLNNRGFALNAFDQARKSKFQDEITRKSHLYVGKLQYELSQYPSAIAVLKDYIKTYPKSKEVEEANELISESYLYSQNYAEAIAYMEGLPNKTTRIQKAYQKITFNRASEAFNRDDFSNTLVYFKKSLQTPTDPTLATEAHFWMAEANAVQKKYPEAIAEYQKVLDEKNVSALGGKTTYGLAYAYYNAKNYKEALKYFEIYVKNNASLTKTPTYQDALIRLADCQYATKNYQEAINTYDKALQAANSKENAYIYYQKGVVYGFLNQPEEARKNLLQVINLGATNLYYDEALFQIAQIELDKGNYNAAITGFSKVLEDKKKHPTAPYALLKRAIAYTNIQNKKAAIQDYQQIIDEYPTHKTSHSAILGLQELLSQEGRSDELAGMLAKYKQTNPKSEALESVEYEAAKGLYFNQSYEKAIKALQAFMKNYPKSNFNYDAEYYLAESYFRTNDQANTLLYHKQVAKKQKTPNFTRSLARIAEIEHQNQQYATAINYYRLLASQTENKKELITAWSGMMEDYYQLKKYDSAGYFSEQIIAQVGAPLGAKNKALLFRGKVSYAAANYVKAIEEFNEVVNAGKDEYGAEAKYLIGDAYYQQADYKKSVETLLSLNEEFPNYENWRIKAFLLLADNYVQLNEVFQAKATLNSIIENSKNKAAVEEAKKKLALIKEGKTSEVGE